MPVPHTGAVSDAVFLVSLQTPVTRELAHLCPADAGQSDDTYRKSTRGWVYTLCIGLLWGFLLSNRASCLIGQERLKCRCQVQRSLPSWMTVR